LVTNEQLYLAIGVPLLFNAILIGVLVAYINAKIEGLGSAMSARFGVVDAKFSAIDTRFTSMDVNFSAIDTRFDAIDKRFDDMRELWRGELRRVEEILDARLKHLEERRP
jgi:hypothetical protein